MRIKKELLGGTTKSKILNGMVKIKEENLGLFLAEGRYDLLESNAPPKKLEPVKNNNDEKTVIETEEEVKKPSKRKKTPPKDSE